jgi:phosphoglycolate phosphatase
VWPQLILFDLDGTLVDSLPDIAGALNHALAEIGRAPLDLAVVRTLVGDGVLRLAERALAEDGRATLVDAADLADRIRRRYEQQPCVASRLYPGIAEALAALVARDVRLAVLTNKPADVARALLQAIGVAGRFDAVIGDGDGFARKPAPVAALSLMARWNASPAQTLMVGDGVPDMQVAMAAGCVAAAALWGYTPRALLAAESPQFFLDSPGDLLPLLSA